MKSSPPADRGRARLRLPDPAGLSPAGFSALVLAILVAATWLGARGLEAGADLRERMRAAELKAASTSPVPYLAVTPATRTLAGGGSGPVVVVRADSAGGEHAARRLCALAEAPGDPRVALRWIALSPAVPPCLAPAKVTVAEPGPGRAAAAELRDARWVVLDAGARVRHSDRTVPDLAHAAATLAVVLGSPSSPTLADARDP